MNNKNVLFLSRADMDRVGPTMSELVDLLQTVFELKGAGKVDLPSKHWLERSENRFFSAMSSYIPDLGYSGCKWQSGDPANSARGLPYIQGLYVLTEDVYGIPVAIMDAEWITGRRTAAASALAVKLFAAPDAATLCIIGCGLQGRSHLEAIKCVLPKLDQVHVFDIRRETAQTFASEMGSAHGVNIVVCDSPQAAVKGCAVVVTGAKIESPPQPVIEASWLEKGVTAITIDYDSYWTKAAMDAMTTIVTDDRLQLESARSHGFFLSVPRIDGDLGDVVSGRLCARRSADDKVLCFNLGIAIEDLITAKFIYERALQAKVGLVLPR